MPPQAPQQEVAAIAAIGTAAQRSAVQRSAQALRRCRWWYKEFFLFFEVMQGFVVLYQAKLIRGSDFGVCSRVRFFCFL